MTTFTKTHALADLYAGLAAILANAARGELPDWFACRGQDWPLFASAKALTTQMAGAVAAMAEVGAGSRKGGCHHLFVGNGRPPIMLYESWHVDGRFPSPTTFAVQAVYRQAGVEPAGELPDHAAVELEFLSFLTEREEEDAGQAQQWRAVRRRFLKAHANRWLPQVARRLAQSDDEAWVAVGLLLTAVLALPDGPRTQKRIVQHAVSLPAMQDAVNCTLCGFCAQTCPTRALRISENEQATRLYLLPESCIFCGKCEKVCDEQVLALTGGMNKETAVLLHESPRAICPRCGQPTVSQAEMAAIVHRLGEHPAWLDYCLNCR